MFRWATANHILLEITTKNHFNTKVSILNLLKSRQIYTSKSRVQTYFCFIKRHSKQKVSYMHGWKVLASWLF